MNTTAQDAFQAFQDNQASPTYVWPATPTEQDAEMREYTRLKIAAMQEIKENQEEAEATAAQEQEAFRGAIEAEMTAKGYSTEGTLEDFVKLFTRPNLNSSNSEAIASSLFNSGADFFQYYLIHRSNA